MELECEVPGSRLLFLYLALESGIKSKYNEPNHVFAISCIHITISQRPDR